MKPFIATALVILISVIYGRAQDSTVLISAKMFDGEQKIVLSAMNGWVFKQGTNLSWANKELNTTDWKKLLPTNLSAALADKTGRVEGWFRLKFKLADDIQKVPLGLLRGSWAATDIYVDGNLLASFGAVGTDDRSYKEYNPIDKLSTSVHLLPETDHVIAMHFVDYLAPFSFRLLRSATINGVRPNSQGLHSILALTGPKFNTLVKRQVRETLLYRSIWVSVTTLLALLFWLLFFLSSGERTTLMFIAIFSSAASVSNLTRFVLTDPNISFAVHRMFDLLLKLCSWVIFVFTFIIVKRTVNFRIPRSIQTLLLLFCVVGAFGIFFNFFLRLLFLSTMGSFLFYLYLFFSFRRKLKGAQWAIVAGLSLTIISAVIFSIFNFTGQGSNYWQILLTGVYFSFPLSLLIYVSLTFREMMREVREKAQQVIEITREKEAQVLKQQRIYKDLLELEAQALRAQMNPHFIYNCMNSIKALIQNDDKFRSIEYLATFSKLIRTLFNNSDKRQITLYDEIETCRLYTQLEAMRLNGKLKYDFRIDPNLDLKSVMVPALIVQPFIENAIWHGIVPKDGGAVGISIKGNDEAIICEVDDDGIGREMSKLNKPATPIIHESKGVHLSQQRLNLEKMLNDTKASIETIDKYENSIATGTKVRLTFNLC